MKGIHQGNFNARISVSSSGYEVGLMRPHQ